MPNFDTENLVKGMMAAALAVLGEKWPLISNYAESEFSKLLMMVTMIKKAQENGEITEEEARLLLDMQKNAMRAVMLTVEGLGIIAVEQAINAALAVVRDAVNRFVGWTIL